MDKFCDSTMDKFGMEKYDKFGKPKEFDESTGCFSSMFSKLSFFHLAYATSFIHSFVHIHSIIIPKLFMQTFPIRPIHFVAIRR